MSGQINKLYFVWNADWSIKGWIEEVKNMIQGIKVCSLCNLAYYGFRKKPLWKGLEYDLKQRGIHTKTMYRNQAKKRFSSLFINSYPVVIAEDVTGKKQILITTDEINNLNGDLPDFIILVFRKLEK